MADAAIAIWNTKYTYNVERPVSYINRLIDPDWKPSLDNHVNGLKGITPPFPAYPSGPVSYTHLKKLYAASNNLHVTYDGGQTWEIISPDPVSYTHLNV